MNFDTQEVEEGRGTTGLYRCKVGWVFHIYKVFIRRTLVLNGRLLARVGNAVVPRRNAWQRRAATPRPAAGWPCGRSPEAAGLAASRLKPGQEWMWFHCASVGESSRPDLVMEAWRSLHPEDAFLLSFYSVLRGGRRSLAASRNGDSSRSRDSDTAGCAPQCYRLYRLQEALTPARAALQIRGVANVGRRVDPGRVPSVCLLAMSCQGGGRFDGAEAYQRQAWKECAVFGCRPRLPCQPCPLMV